MANNHILKIEGFIPKSECDKVIEEFESHPQKMREGKFGNRNVNHDVKKCTESYYYFGKNDDTGFPIINEYLPIAIKKYADTYSNFQMVSEWYIDEIYKVQRYYPNEGYFALHCENASLSTSKRILAWMIYLNDVTDGGYTEFPCQDKKFQPRVGDVLIWPAFFTHPHKGITSKTQTKYISTGWCDYFVKKELRSSYV